MPCTTLLVGKCASYDGSTIAARNEDSGGGGYDPKRFDVILPEQQPRKYKSVLSHVEITLPDNPVRYTAVPNGPDDEGIWAAAGVNDYQVSMTATETITSNERVLGADPLVVFKKATEQEAEVPGGIGEEDMVTITLPYIKSAREGVLRLGALLEQYGTYEMNGIAFQDIHEIWWLETIGGHHWIARRVPDNAYVVMPNQLGIDTFDLDDALGEGREHLCSKDMREFIAENHLNLSMDGSLNAREAFGSHSDADHCYNTPRAWYMLRYFNPQTVLWDGIDAEYTPESDDLPWCMVPEKKITIEDVKYILSSYYQGTPYNPYASYGERSQSGMYRPIGINRNNFLSIAQIRPYRPESYRSIKWLSFASNAFNASVPFYTMIRRVPQYLADTSNHVTTENFYWANRLIGALADAQYGSCLPLVERYQKNVQNKGHELINCYDQKLEKVKDNKNSVMELCEQANDEMAAYLREKTDALLADVLRIASNHMKNAYSRADN